MSVTLTVKMEGGSSPPLTFDATRIVIGRGTGCDMRLPDVSVSQRHASIRVESGEQFLYDEGSTNGTFVGGVRLAPKAPRTLKSGDIIRIGKVHIEFTVDQRPATVNPAMATRDLALGLISRAMESLGDEVSPKIMVVEGRNRGDELKLTEEGQVYLIGRGDTCDLKLDDPDASREHVKVVLRGSTVLVADLDSKNGAMLGEEPLRPGRDTHWKGFLALLVGSTVFTLEEPVAKALAEIENEPDQPIPEGETPEPPRSNEPPKSKRELASERVEATRASGAPVESNAPATLPVPRPKEARSRAPVKVPDGWQTPERAIVIVAVLMIALSALGLLWLFRSK